MDKHVKALLSALRQAINEAILGSHDVNAALAALSRAGQCPSLSVDVALEDPSRLDCAESRTLASLDEPFPAAIQPGELVLTDDDEGFLESLGICAEFTQPWAGEAPLK